MSIWKISFFANQDPLAFVPQRSYASWPLVCATLTRSRPPPRPLRRVLPTSRVVTLHRALRLHGDDGSLEHAQQCLLHALPADVAHAVGAARAGLARDLVDFVDEDDALSGGV